VNWAGLGFIVFLIFAPILIALRTDKTIAKRDHGKVTKDRLDS
jgi:hypothetical protein